jgi:predicted protein tyrosine phosphatase
MKKHGEQMKVDLKNNMPKAININAYQAGDIIQLAPDTVMVSINNEHEQLFPLLLDRKSPKVLTLQFADIQDDKYMNGTTYHPIPEEQAYWLLKFIEEHKGKNFIVHCAAGISRSAAVCLFLHLMHGYDLKENFWKVSHPNKYVVGALMVYYAKNKNNLI